MNSYRKSVMLAAAICALLAPPALAQVPSFSQPALQRPTFAAVSSPLAFPQTGAGDAVCLVGSATKTIRVTSVRVSGTNTTAQSSVVAIVKRTAANTGGTSTQPTIGSYDSNLNNGGATAVVNAYTVIPTAGAGVTLDAQLIPFNVAAGGVGSTLTWEYYSQMKLDQQLVLRGVAQSLCVNFPNAFTTAGPSLTTRFEWTEQ